MRGWQFLQIVGNLGKDPELRYTPQGVSVCTFPVAVNRKWNDASGEAHEETMWVRISVWGPRSESCANYLKKGQPVLVMGRLIIDKATNGPRTYTAHDGSVRASFEMSAENVVFLGGHSPAAENIPVDSVEPPLGGEEDIPF